MKREIKPRYSPGWALSVAINAAKNSPCQSKRGVVIWNQNTGLISIGWNEPPEPFKCDGSDKCKANCSKTAVHAEQMAIINAKLPLYAAEMVHVKIIGDKPVFSEKPSCWQCSKLILASGISTMYLYQRVVGLMPYSAEKFHQQTLENCGLI